MSPAHAQFLCDFPDRIHPVSQLILDYYIDGVISTGEFLRYFSLPNSDYISLAACYVSMITGSVPVAFG